MTDAQRALDLAYKALNRRDRTVAELRIHLEGKLVEPAAIDAAIAELEQGGFLDDARFAQRPRGLAVRAGLGGSHPAGPTRK